jgi:hypothetical protein
MMTDPLTAASNQQYFVDHLGNWHAMKYFDGGHCAVGRCRHTFKLQGPPVTKRPHADKYCAGCKGDEERWEKLQRESKQQPTSAA